MAHGGTHSHTSNDFAYRGYLATYDMVRDQYHISRDGYHIGTTKTVEDTRHAIDQIAD